jgi:hypothetical protein
MKDFNIIEVIKEGILIDTLRLEHDNDNFFLGYYKNNVSGFTCPIERLEENIEDSFLLNFTNCKYIYKYKGVAI